MGKDVVVSYYITGDCHGEFSKIEWFVRHHKTTTDDVMVLLGDVGLNYYFNERDQKNKSLLADMPLTFLCVHGNHEERPSNISSYKKKDWKNGRVYYEENYPNILFAVDGEVYDFDGKKAVAIGGAYSIDKDYRLMVGLPWFSEEQPTAQIKQYVEKQLIANEWKVQYVFSHTCPLEYEPVELFLDLENQEKADKSTEKWLSGIAKKLQFEKWYFGHFHGNKTYCNAELLYEGIAKIGQDGLIQKVGCPKYRTGEMVLFDYEEKGKTEECYGRISQIYPSGTKEHPDEVLYDIEGPDLSSSGKRLFRCVAESELQSLNDMQAGLFH